MELFHVIEDGAVILRVAGGTYKQAKIYRRGNQVFAGLGGTSFVRLIRGGGTSKPNVSWLEVEGPGVLNDPLYTPTWIDEKPTAIKSEAKLKAVS